MLIALTPARNMRGMGFPPELLVPRVRPVFRQHVFPVRVTGMRGLGSGQVHQYCQSSPPNQQTIDDITAVGDSIQLIPCSYSTGAPGVTGIAPAGTPPVTGSGNGPQPSQNLPAPPQYEDCAQYGLASSAAAACVARNVAAQTAWQNNYIQAQQNYNIAMCEWNGDPASYCNQIFSAGQNTAISTPVPVPGQTGGVQRSGSVGSVFITLTDTTTQSVNPASVNVGDGWRVYIYGAQPNAQVTAQVSGPTNASFVAGTTDGSGNFQTTGNWAASDVGSWSEVWSVGGVAVGTFSFTVIGPAGGASGAIPGPSGSPIPPVQPLAGSSTGTQAALQQAQQQLAQVTGGATSTGSTSTGSIISGIPDWALYAGGAALVLVLVVASGK